MHRYLLFELCFQVIRVALWLAAVAKRLCQAGVGQFACSVVAASSSFAVETLWERRRFCARSALKRRHGYPQYANHKTILDPHARKCIRKDDDLSQSIIKPLRLLPALSQPSEQFTCYNHRPENTAPPHTLCVSPTPSWKKRGVTLHGTHIKHKKHMKI